jgi:hypothetical protein
MRYPPPLVKAIQSLKESGLDDADIIAILDAGRKAINSLKVEVGLVYHFGS